MKVTREMITVIMQKHSGHDLKTKLNELIHPQEPLGRNGCQLSCTHSAGQGKQRFIIFPQWVELVDPDKGNSFCFWCDDHGRFERW